MPAHRRTTRRAAGKGKHRAIEYEDEYEDEDDDTSSSSHRSHSVFKSKAKPSTWSSHLHWTVEDENALIDIAIANQMRMGSEGHFRESFWHSVARQFSSSTTGKTKSMKSYKEKWRRMRSTFAVVELIANTPGLTYTLEKGADICTANQHVWNNVLRGTKGASRFKNEGWVHYERMKPLMSSKPQADDVVEPPIQVQRPQSSLSGMSTSTSRDVEMALVGSPHPHESPNTSFAPLAPFTPPSAPSSYVTVGSALSPLRPSSSISARIERLNQHRSENDDSSVVSVTAEEISGLRNDVKALHDTFRANMEVMEARISTSPVRPLSENTTMAKRQIARTKLLELDKATLTPEEIVTVFDVFAKNGDFVDGYLLLATSPGEYADVRLAWLKKRIADNS